MHHPDRHLPPRPASSPRARALCRGLFAGLVVGLIACPQAPAQDREPTTLRLGGVAPGGVRNYVTTNWGTFDLNLTNLTDTDRQARVLVFYAGRPDQQYGRDVWVPARSTLSTWMLVGPAAGEHAPTSCDIQVLLYDRSGGEDRLILPPGEERIRSRGVIYREREPSTTLMVDEDPPEETVFGRLPQPDSRAEEAARLVRTSRHARKLSAAVSRVWSGSLPVTAEALDGTDLLVLASGRVAHDPVGLRALRQWLERGGRVWAMLDLVEPDVLAPLLGDALDFQVVDRVSLTDLTIQTPPAGQHAPEVLAQQHERPVEFARVLLPPGERVRHTVNGWPAWFTRDVGRGKVIFTTLGPRAWYQPRKPKDPPSPYENFPDLPVPTVPLVVMADELLPPPEAKPFPVEAFRPLLTQEIGYSVAGRGTVGLVFAAFLAVTLALGAALRRSRRPELLGWVGPAAALGAAGAFLALGEASRRAAPPTVAVAQVVDAVPGTAEVPVHGLLAVYRPDSGPAEVGAEQGGLFEPDMTGIEGRTRRLILTDMDAWHWENLNLPAGVRLAPFRYTAPTGEPLTAVARFGPDGLEGRLAAGPFRDPADALLSMAEGRNLAVRLRPDGTFSAGSQDVLPAGQFLAAAVLSDRQQRRQDIYREAVKRTGRPESRNVLLAWAQPIDTHFTLAPGARTVGSALLVIPLRLERPAPGGRVTIPGPFVPYRRLLDNGPIRPTLDSDQGIDMHLRFQLPAEVLPLQVERARLVGKINAPGRRVTAAGRAGDQLVELHRVESPLDPIRVDITEERLLRPDEEGGLHVHVAVSELLGGREAGPGTLRVNERWTVEYLELEVVGRAAP